MYLLQKEKKKLCVHIGDVKSNLLSMQETLKSLYSRNELIQIETNTLKDECKEFQMEKASNQQSREEFLCSLLNQLTIIEKHVEDREKNSEVRKSLLCIYFILLFIAH